MNQLVPNPKHVNFVAEDVMFGKRCLLGCVDSDAEIRKLVKEWGFTGHGAGDC